MVSDSMSTDRLLVLTWPGLTFRHLSPTTKQPVSVLLTMLLRSFTSHSASTLSLHKPGKRRCLLVERWDCQRSVLPLCVPALRDKRDCSAAPEETDEQSEGAAHPFATTVNQRKKYDRAPYFWEVNDTLRFSVKTFHWKRVPLNTLNFNHYH